MNRQGLEKPIKQPLALSLPRSAKSQGVKEKFLLSAPFLKLLQKVELLLEQMIA